VEGSLLFRMTGSARGPPTRSRDACHAQSDTFPAVPNAFAEGVSHPCASSRRSRKECLLVPDSLVRRRDILGVVKGGRR